MKASLQGKDNTIRKLRVKISQLKETRSEADRTLDFKALDFQITKLTEKAQIIEKRKCVTIDSVKPKVLSPGVNCYTEASESKPRSNIKNNMILPAKSVNKKKVEDHPRKRLYEKGNLHANVVRIRADLDSIPASLDVDPFNATLREAEAKCVVEFNQA
ncbi:hypothetical protein Tco_1179190, partial [Tanacetum coccineum]